MSRFAALCLIILFLPGVSLGSGGESDDRPNIILINLDDADLDLLAPETIVSRFPSMGRLVTDGLFFSNLHVTTPICGPSRACLLRGQYAHRTGIRVNDSHNPNHNGFAGGMPDYIERGHTEEELSVWMKRAGYRTMLIGRYLNGKLVQGVPPGWDDYYFSLGGSYYETWRYTNRSNLEGQFEQLDPGVYRTAAEAEDAVGLIQNHLDSGEDSPFFLYLAPLAPHQPATNAVGGASEDPYSRWWTKAVVPFAPDKHERDFSDKTSVFESIEALNEPREEYVNSVYRDRLRSTRSFDDMFGLLMDKLESEDLLDSTYVIVTSDNGFQLGHQRMIGKGNNYDRSTRVPLYIIGPNVAQAERAEHLLAHIDITATVLELAGASATVPQDGKSFVPLLENPTTVEPSQWRDPVLIQNWESRVLPGGDGQRVHVVASGLRMFDAIYTEWADGTREYFDLESDPYQLENTYGDLPGLEQEALKILLRDSKSEMVPITSIAKPLTHDKVVSDQFVISGLAEDNDGISEVRLTIRDIQTRQYWDGEQWSDDFARVSAEIKRPGQQISVWRYSNLPPAGDAPRSIVVWARSYTEDYQYDLFPANRRMQIAPLNPQGEILYPTPGEKMTGPFKIQGNHGLNQDIQRVHLVVLRLSDRKYWNGSHWTSQWASVRPSVGRDDWEYEIDVAPGAYFISSRLQNSHAVQKVPAKSHFVVDDK